MDSSELKRVSCCNCGALIAKADIKEGVFSIKCRKCGSVTTVVVEIKKPESRGYTDRLGLHLK